MSPGRPAPPCLAPLLVAAIVALLAPLAAGQPTGSLPAPSYYAGVADLYAGDYRGAQRGLSRMSGALKTLNARWVDSIPYAAMLGETYFQQGDNARALAEYNRACELLLAYPDWMQRVTFHQAPQVGALRPAQTPPWGRPARPVAYGFVPRTMLVSQGRVDNSQQYSQGGVVQTAQYWKLDVVEVWRATALAIRRRNQLLGPLGPHDKLSRALADRLERGGLGPRNHWSSAWSDLAAGLALVGVGKPRESQPFLERATLLEGRLDHELTGAALLAQAWGRLASDTPQGAVGLAAEAALAAFAYEDLDALTEALWLSHLLQAAGGPPGVYPPLPTAAAWAERERLDHIAYVLRLGVADGLIGSGDAAQGAQALAAATPRGRDLPTGRWSIQAARLNAHALLLQGRGSAAQKPLADALARQAAASLHNFQVAMANAQFDSGQLSPRVATLVYRTLLTDPAQQHWALDPLDALAVLQSDHEGAFDRWFASHVARKEYEEAFYVADLQKRARFLRGLPLGGRLVALRRLTAAPDDRLSATERAERDDLFKRFPTLQGIAAETVTEAQNLAATPNPLGAEGQGPNAEAFEGVARAAERHESALGGVALSRAPTTLGLPPRLSAQDTRQRLAPGEALVVFHRAAGAMHGIVLVADGVHYWRLPDPTPLAGEVARVLRALGCESASRPLSRERLASDAWREESQRLAKTLIGDARLDFSALRKLTVVPDGPVWYAPLEALLIESTDGVELLVDRTAVRVAPTVGFAYAPDAPRRAPARTAVTLGPEPRDAADREVQELAWGSLSAGLPGAVRLEGPTPTPSAVLGAAVDRLVSLVPLELQTNDPLALRLLPTDRSRAAGRLDQWLELPAEAPEVVVLTALHTAAESALKGGRRERASGRPPGDELFQASCGLMTAGVRTALLSLWATDGATSRELARELTAGLEAASAPDAWRRSVALSRASRIDPDLEPRYARDDSAEEPPLAEHPFFWSGFLLLDDGHDPASPGAAHEADDAEADDAKAGAPERAQAAPAGG